MNTCTKPKKWTKDGLAQLGQIIRASRESQGLSLRDAAKLIFERTEDEIKFPALGEIERGVVEPRYNTLAILAAAGIAKDPQTDRLLTIEDFLAIASESYQWNHRDFSSNVIDKIPVSINAGISMHLSEMIILAMQFYGISQEELEARLLERRSPLTMSIDRLRAIQSGADATEDERRIVYILLDNRGDVFTRGQWMGEEPIYRRETREERNGDPCNGRS